MKPTQQLNIREIKPLVSPKTLLKDLPMDAKSNETVVESRDVITRILNKEDKRLLVVVGPCSIYDPKAALEYAEKLSILQSELSDVLYIVMRAYFEKPRTTVGWKGYLNDPVLSGKGDIEKGLYYGRELLLKITGMGMPIATEMLDPIVPQYLADLVSWASIGARTTESQTHREMASGLSMPVGFKNSTEGNLDVAINAMEAARHPHDFVGINDDGQTAIIKTKGNPWGHVILRGGKTPNYDPETIAYADEHLRQAGFEPAILIDCSHGNSSKKHENQATVARAVLDLVPKFPAIIGLMLESNLFEGNQKITDDVSKLKYGVSITDACIGWDTTEALLREAAARLRK
jgi:3-deoxy-7-phosphoheptulonate synthase